MSDLTITRLSAVTEDLFARVHDNEVGEGWCHCTAWWVDTWDGFPERSAVENQALRQNINAGEDHDGFILLAAGEPIGWCQVTNRSRLPMLKVRYGPAPDDEVFAITCWVLHPEHRGKGLAHLYLDLILTDLRLRGVTRVQAFPHCGDDLEAGQVWTGPESLYLGKGFQEIVADRTWPVLELILS